MRYLRKYNESNDSESDLVDFCQNYLAYLIDEGFCVRVDKRQDNVFRIGLWLDKPYYETPTYNHKYYIWNDIKDHFVPFLQMLIKSYTLSYFDNFKDVFIVADQRQPLANDGLYYFCSDIISGEVEDELQSFIIEVIMLEVKLK